MLQTKKQYNFNSNNYIILINTHFNLYTSKNYLKNIIFNKQNQQTNNLN